MNTTSSILDQSVGLITRSDLGASHTFSNTSEIVPHFRQITKALPLEVFVEFRESAIPDNLTLANVEWVEGEEAVLLLASEAMNQAQRETSYITKAAARIRDRYQFAAAGGWLTYGCNLDGTPADVPYVKPVTPRTETKTRGFGAAPKVKTVKYETPEKCPALPILAYVDEQSAIRIFERYDISQAPGESFWQTILRCGVPIAICEGFKKALSLIAHGLPAIVSRGIYHWRTTGTDELHPIIAQLATPGRKVYIAFDQDEQIKTQIAVRGQAIKLGTALQKYSCEIGYLHWDGALGKGVDDVLYGQGGNAQAWLEAALEDAWTLKQYKREGARAAARGSLKRLSESLFPIERFTEGAYLPELPKLQQGAIHVVNASMNSGKTTAIGRDWVAEARRRDWFTLVLAPLNSLGMQTAKNWAFPHIHDFGTSVEQQRLLWAQASYSGGVVMCPDSLHRLPTSIFDRPILLVLDEANQTIHHTTRGGTLGDRWSLINGRLGEVAAHAAMTGAIVLSEDGLPDRAIRFMQKLSGAASVRVFKHIKRGAAWACSLFTGQASGFRAQLLQAAQNQRLLYASTSQAECKKLEHILKQRYPHLKVARIDSETNEGGAFNRFFEKPDQWLQDEQPDILILSPSAKSGVSIEGAISVENAYFQSVWGYFSCLDTDSQMQLLGRYRPAVPRFIFCPQFIQGESDEDLHTPRAIQRRLNLNAQALAGVYGIELALSDRDPRALEIECAALEYIAESQAVAGNQKAIAHDYLRERLESAGHSIECFQAMHDAEMVELWWETKDAIDRDNSEEGAALVIDPGVHTLEWARRTQDGLDSSRGERLRARKVLLRHEFPGVSFDDPREWYECVYKDRGAMRRGVNLQAMAENPEAAKELDRHKVEGILSDPLRALHRLPKNYAKAMLLSRLGVLDLLDGEYHDSDPRAIAVKEKALRFAPQIYEYLRLTIKSDQGAAAIVNKLVRKLGLDAVETRKEGGRGQQKRRYRASGQDNPVRLKMLEAVRRRLSDARSHNLYLRDNPPKQIVTTDHNPPINQGWASPGTRVWWGMDVSLWVIESIEADRAHIRTLKGDRPAAPVPLCELQEVAA